MSTQKDRENLACFDITAPKAFGVSMANIQALAKRPEEMDRWCRDFDNRGICDTLCFHLFERTPHAWSKVAEWSDEPDEFVKRAAYALLASLAGHDKRAID